MTDQPRSFRDRFLSAEPMVGSFLKIAHTMPAEILGALGYDFVVVDEEHAPINRESTDRILLACRATGLGGLVRVQSADPAGILSVLDCGADGILVPHVDSAERARSVVAAARYRNGARGYSATTRAGAFGGQGIRAHLDQQDASATVIAMIEDVHALPDLDAILAVDGLDGVFIGRGDLTVAFGQDVGGSPPVREATDRIIEAAVKIGKTVCVMASGPEDAEELARKGAAVFIIASDQTFIRRAALSALAETREKISPKA